MICALLIFQRTTFDRSLDLISPWLDAQFREIGDVIADLEGQQHRRFIKTHTPLDGLPDEAAVTYICVGRDPRDVAISWAHHQDNINMEALFAARERAVGNEDLAEILRDREPPPSDPLARFWQWVDDSRQDELKHVSLASVMHHLATFWEVREQPNVVLVHYADLQRDLEGEMRSIAQRLDIDIDEDRLPDLVAAAGFDTMRERADEITPESTAGIFRATERSSTWAATANGKNCSMRQDGVDTPSESSSSHRPTSSSGHTTKPSSSSRPSSAYLPFGGTGFAAGGMAARGCISGKARPVVVHRPRSGARAVGARGRSNASVPVRPRPGRLTSKASGA